MNDAKPVDNSGKTPKCGKPVDKVMQEYVDKWRKKRKYQKKSEYWKSKKDHQNEQAPVDIPPIVLKQLKKPQGQIGKVRQKIVETYCAEKGVPSPYEQPLGPDELKKITPPPTPLEAALASPPSPIPLVGGPNGESARVPFSREMVEKVCTLMMEGGDGGTVMSLKNACAIMGWLPGTFLGKLCQPKYQDLWAMYSKAMQGRADLIAEAAMELADTANFVNYNAIRLRVDTMKWAAAKLNPGRWGDASRLTAVVANAGVGDKMSPAELDKLIVAKMAEIAEMTGEAAPSPGDPGNPEGPGEEAPAVPAEVGDNGQAGADGAEREVV